MMNVCYIKCNLVMFKCNLVMFGCINDNIKAVILQIKNILDKIDAVDKKSFILF